MLGFRKLTLVQAKLYLREPMAAFFALLFGPSLLILLGFIFENDPDPMLGGLGYLDRSVSGYMAMIIAIVGLTAVPISSAMRRESGALRRFSATPLRPLTYFLTDVLVPFLMTLVGILLVLRWERSYSKSSLRAISSACLGGLPWARSPSSLRATPWSV